jgi:hypothetical protein
VDGARQARRQGFTRNLAASWKSRQKARLAERDKQLAEVEETGPLGV